MLVISAFWGFLLAAWMRRNDAKQDVTVESSGLPVMIVLSCRGLGRMFLVELIESHSMDIPAKAQCARIKWSWCVGVDK